MEGRADVFKDGGKGRSRAQICSPIHVASFMRDLPAPVYRWVQLSHPWTRLDRDKGDEIARPAAW